MTNRSYLYSTNVVPGPQAKAGGRRLIGCRRTLTAAVWWLIVLLPLTGCIPYTATYVALDPPPGSVPEPAPVSRVQSCYGYGPPLGITYHLEGTRFLVALSGAHLGLSHVIVHVPREIPVSIHDPFVTVRASDGSPPQRIAIRAQGTKIGASGSLQTSSFIPRRGAPLSDKSVAVYAFWLESLPRLGSSGTLQLPDLTVNGRWIPGAYLPYEVRGHVGYRPFNC